MYLLKLFLIPFYLLLLSNALHAIVYENGEDKTIKGWELLTPFKKGSISNVYDKKRKSYIIKLDGLGTRSAYILKLKSNTKLPPIKVLQWEMHYDEDFVIMVDASTQKGQRLLIYTPSDTSSGLQFGLGKSAVSKNWKQFSRNLEDDLKRYEENNTIISLNNFIIRGSGQLDNIELLLNNEIKIPVKNPLPPKPKVKTVVKKTMPKKDTKMPTITLLGENPLVLSNGEKYKEAGAIAHDVNGDKLSITISQNIDIFKNGEYSVIYMTKNSLGNTAVDRRVVRVGKVTSTTAIPRAEPKTVKEPIEEEEPAEDTPIKDAPTSKELEEELKKKVLFERELLKIDRPVHPGM